jgi:hypothetical protein
MESRNERRESANRSRVRQHLLKRLAVLALSLAVALLLIPRLLVELGMLGPTVEDRLAEAERTVGVARSYGAAAQDPAMAAAERELAEARRLLGEGRSREARAAAVRASGEAVAAQREALVRRGELRRQAQVVVADLDRGINALEDLYGEVTPGLPKPEVSRLFTRMKRAREASGTLFLAFEEDQYDRVIAGHAHARAVLQEVGKELREARVSPTAPAPAQAPAPAPAPPPRPSS